MGIGAGIWGACQVLGVLWCVLFSARVAIADNSKYNSAGPDVKFWTPQNLGRADAPDFSGDLV